jgi:hypothetical protein
MQAWKRNINSECGGDTVLVATCSSLAEGKDEAIGSRGVIFHVLLAQVAGVTY